MKDLILFPNNGKVQQKVQIKIITVKENVIIPKGKPLKKQSGFLFL